MGPVRLNNEDASTGTLKTLQILENKMLRMVTNSKLKDHKHTADLVKESGLLSINQLNAQSKLLETWKALNINKYPIRFNKTPKNVHETRLSTDDQRLVVSAKTKRACATFIGDCPKVWNCSSSEVKNAKTLYGAKKAIKKYVQKLPI
jgi:hypothetical protein